MILVCGTCSDDNLDHVEQADGEAPIVSICSQCGGPWPEEIETALTFAELREANVARCEQAFHPVNDWSAGDWCNAIAGEVGEIAGVLKKARRKDPHYTPSPALRRMLADEIADAVIYTDLLCARLGPPLPTSLSSETEEQVRVDRKTSFYETFAGLDIASTAWVADQVGPPWSPQEHPRSTSGAVRSAHVMRAMGRLAARVMALGDGEAIVGRLVEQGGSSADSASFIQDLVTGAVDAARDLILELGRLAAVFRIDTGRAVRDKFNEVSVKRCGCPILLGDTGVVSVSEDGSYHVHLSPPSLHHLLSWGRGALWLKLGGSQLRLGDSLSIPGPRLRGLSWRMGRDLEPGRETGVTLGSRWEPPEGSVMATGKLVAELKRFGSGTHMAPPWVAEHQDFHNGTRFVELREPDGSLLLVALKD